MGEGGKHLPKSSGLCFVSFKLLVTIKEFLDSESLQNTQRSSRESEAAADDFLPGGDGHRRGSFTKGLPQTALLPRPCSLSVLSVSPEIFH